MCVILGEVGVDLPPQGHGDFEASARPFARDQVGGRLLEAGVVPPHAPAALQHVLAALQVLAAEEHELPVVRHMPQALFEKALAERWVKGAVVLNHQERSQLLLPIVPHGDVLPDEQVRESAADRPCCQIEAKELATVRQEIPLLGQVGDHSSLRQSLNVNAAAVHCGKPPRRQAQALELPLHELPALRAAVQIYAVDILDKLVPPSARTCVRRRGGSPAPGTGSSAMSHHCSSSQR
mmetsp:Transcript_41456/g.111956  ORF Transcript_41456/g.111956 Transcript_41456/m.111956 type:complete len:237 (+) Transcript_41456:338-1048(+)